MRIGATSLAVLWAGVLACGTATTAADPGSGSGNAESTTTGTTGGTTFDVPEACASSEECAGGYCVAPYDAAAPTAAAGMGEPICVGACVPELALDRWCVDDDACCGGLSCRGSDGLCVGPGGGSESSTADSWATLDSSSSSAGTTDGETTSSTGDATTGTSSTG